MPIVRTFGCPECGNFIEVVLTMEQWDVEPPDCPVCLEHEARQEADGLTGDVIAPAPQMVQHFKAPGVVNSSPYSRARKIAEDIAENDYNVADMRGTARQGDRRQVRYKDQTPSQVASNFAAAAQGSLAQAVALGRQTRLQHGNGLDVLKSGLKDGSIPDLIRSSKAKSIRVW